MDLRSTGNVDPEDIGSNPSTEPSMGELIERRLNRRDAMRGLLGASAAAAFSQVPTPASAQAGGPSSLTFKELAHTLDADQHVAEGYATQVLIRWGDPVAPAPLPSTRQTSRAPPRRSSSATTTTISACIRCPPTAVATTAS